MEARALGKGLSALIPDKPKKENQAATIKVREIKYNSLQPRQRYDDTKLAELMASIQDKGVIQPILVRKKDGQYEVVAGERRLRAAQALNMEEVPAIVKDVSDQEALVLALIENIQRESLNPIEEAQAFRRLIEEFALTQDQVAQSVGKDRSTVSNLIRLLKLPVKIQTSVADGVISEGHARALLGAPNDRDQNAFFEYTIKKGLSVRELEQAVKHGLHKTNKKPLSKSVTKDNDLIAVEEELQKVLGTKVNIMAKQKRGKIIIEYYSNEDLDRILEVIKK